MSVSILGASRGVARLTRDASFPARRFWDPQTTQLALNSPAMLRAARYYQKLHAATPEELWVNDGEPGGCYGILAKLWAEGRCAFGRQPGGFLVDLFNDNSTFHAPAVEVVKVRGSATRAGAPARRRGLTPNEGERPRHADAGLGRVPLLVRRQAAAHRRLATDLRHRSNPGGGPGTQELGPCTPERCWYASPSSNGDGRLVNRAPYDAAPGYTASISAYSTQAEATYDFISWLADDPQVAEVAVNAVSVATVE